MILWLSEGMAASMQVLLAPDLVEGIPEGSVTTIGMGNVTIDQTFGCFGASQKARKCNKGKDEGLHFGLKKLIIC